MKKANIETRTEGVTKDMAPEGERVQKYHIPSLGMTVEAKSLSEALVKAKEIIKENSK